MININKIQVLRNIEERSKKELEKIMVRFQVNKKEILFHEKECIDNLYFVEEGKVSIYKLNENGERKIIFMLKEGDMINDVSFNKDVNTIFGCEAFEKSTILKCNTSQFIGIMENDFKLMKNILANTQNINRRLYRQLKNSISIRLDKKLAAKLYRLSREFGEEKGEWTLINANISITYIAEMLGYKRESVSRAMKELQNQDLVKINNSKIYIKKEEISNYFKSQ